MEDELDVAAGTVSVAHGKAWWSITTEGVLNSALGAVGGV